MKIHWLFPLISVLFLSLILGAPQAFADPSPGGAAAVSVADACHNAASVAALSQELDAVMAQIASATTEGERKKLIEKAKNIFAKLMEQANNVESEISILSKKKLGKQHLAKLSRVLSTVLTLKSLAQNKMQALGVES